MPGCITGRVRINKKSLLADDTAEWDKRDSASCLFLFPRKRKNAVFWYDKHNKKTKGEQDMAQECVIEKKLIEIKKEKR